MKKIAFIILMAVVVFLSSCKDDNKQKDCTVWTGEEFDSPHFGGIRSAIPVCAVWYKKSSVGNQQVWKPYKSFSQTDINDMRDIILSLAVPETKEPNQNLKTADKLSLIFYNGFPETLAVREVYFEIKDNIFIGPMGKSEKIAKILFKSQEIRSGFYYPYTEMDPTRYLDNWEIILKTNETTSKDYEKN